MIHREHKCLHPLTGRRRWLRPDLRDQAGDSRRRVILLALSEPRSEGNSRTEVSRAVIFTIHALTPSAFSRPAWPRHRGLGARHSPPDQARQLATEFGLAQIKALGYTSKTSFIEQKFQLLKSYLWARENLGSRGTERILCHR